MKKKVTITIAHDIDKKLYDIAKEEGQSKSAIITNALNDYFKRS